MGQVLNQCLEKLQRLWCKSITTITFNAWKLLEIAWSRTKSLNLTSNSLKIALVRALYAKVRARALQNAKKRTFGGPRVPQGVKMEPKWSQIEPQNVLKIEVSKKSAESGLDSLFTVYTHYRHPPKISFFDTSKQAKCKSFPRAASVPPRGCKVTPMKPKNGESGVPGLTKGAKGSPNAFKNGPKIDKNSRKHGINGIAILILHGKTRIKWHVNFIRRFGRFDVHFTR